MRGGCKKDSHETGQQGRNGTGPNRTRGGERSIQGSKGFVGRKGWQGRERVDGNRACWWEKGKQRWEKGSAKKKEKPTWEKKSRIK